MREKHRHPVHKCFFLVPYSQLPQPSCASSCAHLTEAVKRMRAQTCFFCASKSLNESRESREIPPSSVALNRRTRVKRCLPNAAFSGSICRRSVIGLKGHSARRQAPRRLQGLSPFRAQRGPKPDPLNRSSYSRMARAPATDAKQIGHEKKRRWCQGKYVWNKSRQAH